MQLYVDLLQHVNTPLAWCLHLALLAFPHLMLLNQCARGGATHISKNDKLIIHDALRNRSMRENLRGAEMHVEAIKRPVSKMHENILKRIRAFLCSYSQWG